MRFAIANFVTRHRGDERPGWSRCDHGIGQAAPGHRDQHAWNRGSDTLGEQFRSARPPRQLIGDAGDHAVEKPLDHLHRTTAPFELGGRTLRALSAPARVLHVAYHAVVGSTTATWPNLRDLARYFSQGVVPVGDVVDEARRWGGEAVLATAVELVHAELTVDAAEWRAWAETTVIDPR